MVIPLLNGDAGIELTYAILVTFKGNVTFAAAATDKENKPGGSGGGMARVQVEMRERYAVSRFIEFSTKRKAFGDTGGPTQYTLFHRTGPCRIFGGPFDQSCVSFQTLTALWELATSCGFRNLGIF